MKKFTTLFVVILAVVFSASTVLAAAPDKIDYKGGEKGKVSYDHKKHSGSIPKCAECHHKDAAGKEAKCVTCHLKGKAQGKTVELKEAFHKNCKDCHKQMKKGPEKCDGCHKK